MANPVSVNTHKGACAPKACSSRHDAPAPALHPNGAAGPQLPTLHGVRGDSGPSARSTLRRSWGAHGTKRAAATETSKAARPQLCTATGAVCGVRRRRHSQCEWRRPPGMGCQRQKTRSRHKNQQPPALSRILSAVHGYWRGGGRGRRGQVGEAQAAGAGPRRGGRAAPGAEPRQARQRRLQARQPRLPQPQHVCMEALRRVLRFSQRP